MSDLKLGFQPNNSSVFSLTYLQLAYWLASIYVPFKQSCLEISTQNPDMIILLKNLPIIVLVWIHVVACLSRLTKFCQHTQKIILINANHKQRHRYARTGTAKCSDC